MAQQKVRPEVRGMGLTVEALVKQNTALLAAFQERLGYRFSDPALLQQALIHSSFSFEQKGALRVNNERLEFLGDAVLDLTVGQALFRLYPKMNEGDLTRLRAALVNESHLAIMAREIDLGEYLLLGKGEEASAGRGKSSILACGYEAVIGALFLDGGFGAADVFVREHFTPWFEKRRETMFSADSKSSLQELLQDQHNEPPVYMLEKEEGPDHDKRFDVSVRFRGRILGRGRAKSKKEAEQRAAAQALEHFDSLHLDS